MGKVYVFNPTATGYYVNVNNAPPTKVKTLDGTSDSASWVPNSTTFDRASDGQASAEVFGWSNKVQVTPVSGTGTAASVQIDIPRSIQTPNNLQLYIYYDGSSSAGWALMNQGSLIAGNDLGRLAAAQA